MNDENQFLNFNKFYEHIFNKNKRIDNNKKNECKFILFM